MSVSIIDRRRLIGGLVAGTSLGTLVPTALTAGPSPITTGRRRIVVTTPTGKIGHRVVRELLDHDVDVRIVARERSSLAPDLLARRLPPSILARVEVIRGSHGDATIVDRAFAGADTVLWICPPVDAAPDPMVAYVGFSRPARDALVRHKVRNVISVSGLGRGTPPERKAGFATASFAMDDMLAATGIDFRALALPPFMDNIAEQAQSIRDKGVFVSAIDSNRRLPTCATKDIATVATRSILDTAWRGRDERAVLGPEDLSFNQMAQIMTEVLGKPVRFERISFAEYEKRFRGFGLSAGMARGQTDLARAHDAGLDNGERRTAATASPTTFRQWCEEELKPLVQA